MARRPAWHGGGCSLTSRLPLAERARKRSRSSARNYKLPLHDPMDVLVTVIPYAAGQTLLRSASSTPTSTAGRQAAGVGRRDRGSRTAVLSTREGESPCAAPSR